MKYTNSYSVNSVVTKSPWKDTKICYNSFTGGKYQLNHFVSYISKKNESN